MQITLEVPDQFIPNLVPPGQDAARMFFEEGVAGAYRERRLTIKQVRELLGYGTRMEVEEFLGKHEIYDYTIEDFKQDMETLDRLLGPRERSPNA